MATKIPASVTSPNHDIGDIQHVAFVMGQAIEILLRWGHKTLAVNVYDAVQNIFEKEKQEYGQHR